MNKMKLNIPMFTALILLLLTMVTTHMTSGLYARYTAQASGTATARVARFDVTAAVVETKTAGEYTLNVTNNSEVTVEYKIIVENLSDRFSVTLGNETKTPASGETSVTFDGSELAPGAKCEGVMMTFAVADWAGVTDANTKYGTSETVKLNFTVKIDAIQKD